METQLKVSNYRTQQWISIFHECKNSGLTNKDWCVQNNISLSAYYYWLRKIRSEADLPEQRLVQISPNQGTVAAPNTVTIRNGSVSAEIPQGTSRELIELIIAAMKKAC
jgi:hypothetical protein